MDPSFAGAELDRAGELELSGLMDLVALYCSIRNRGVDAGNDNYPARQVPGFSLHFVARSLGGPALLLPTAPGSFEFRPPLEFENLSVRFGARCTVVDNEERVSGSFTIIRCLSADGVVQEYFLHVVEKLLLMLGPGADVAEIERAINRLAELFLQLGRPPLRSTAGLFGELMVVFQSSNPRAAMSAWRIDDDNRFDFVSQDGRLEVKTSATRRRVHEFSYEQCAVVDTDAAILVSMFVEQIGGGIGIQEIAARIEARLPQSPDLVTKLHLNIAKTLGSELTNALKLRFDERLAVSSTRYFLLADIPAVRGPFPSEISGVRFRSNLEGVSPATIEVILATNCGDVKMLLPDH